MLDNAKIMLSARVERADLLALDQLAKVYELSRSETLRRAIRSVAAERGLIDAAPGQEVRSVQGAS